MIPKYRDVSEVLHFSDGRGMDRVRAKSQTGGDSGVIRDEDHEKHMFVGMSAIERSGG